MEREKTIPMQLLKRCSKNFDFRWDVIFFLGFSLSMGPVIAWTAESSEFGDHNHLPPSQWTVAVDGTGQFVSIQEAIDQAEPGATIFIKKGRYQEDVTVYSKENLKVIGEGMDLVTITGLERVGTLHIGKWPYGATNVEIQNMTIHQHGGLGVGIFNGSGVVLRNIRIKGMIFGQQVNGVRIEDSIIGGSETTGVAFANTQAILVGNVIHDNDHGVAVGGTSQVSLKYNVITRSLFEAVLVTDQTHVTLVQNTLIKNGGGVSFQNETVGEVRGNIVGDSKAAFTFSPKSQIALSVNALHNNERDYLMEEGSPKETSLAYGKTDFHLAPKFVDPEKGDFRLQPDTPLREIGRFPYLGALPPMDTAP